MSSLTYEDILNCTEPEFDTIPVSTPFVRALCHCLYDVLKQCIEILKKAGYETVPKESEDESPVTEQSMVDFILYLQDKARITTSELNIAAYLLDKILRRHFKKKFILTNQNVMLSFLCCIIIGHKISNDKPLPNTFWADLTRIPLHTINSTELYLITLLDFRVWMEREVFIEYNSAICNLVGYDKSKAIPRPLPRGPPIPQDSPPDHVWRSVDMVPYSAVDTPPESPIVQF